MAQPAFADIQTRAETAALRRLANARLAASGVAFDCLLAQEVHPMGLVGEMGELRSTLRCPRADLPATVVRDGIVDYDLSSYSPAELAAKKPASFRVDAIEQFGAASVRVWLR